MVHALGRAHQYMQTYRGHVCINEIFFAGVIRDVGLPEGWNVGDNQLEPILADVSCISWKQLIQPSHYESPPYPCIRDLFECS